MYIIYSIAQKKGTFLLLFLVSFLLTLPLSCHPSSYFYLLAQVSSHPFPSNGIRKNKAVSRDLAIDVRIVTLSETGETIVLNRKPPPTRLNWWTAELVGERHVVPMVLMALRQSESLSSDIIIFNFYKHAVNLLVAISIYFEGIAQKKGVLIK